MPASEERVQEAVDVVQATGKAPREVGKDLSVPTRQIMTRLQEKESASSTCSSLESPLDTVQEAKLAQWCQNRADAAVPLTLAHVRKAAYSFAKGLKKARASRGRYWKLDPFDEKWLAGFVQRHPSLRALFKQGGDPTRCRGESTMDSDRYFDIVCSFEKTLKEP